MKGKFIPEILAENVSYPGRGIFYWDMRHFLSEFSGRSGSKLVNFGLMLNCFGLVRSWENIIGLVRGQGHKIYYFSVWFGSGQKITGSGCQKPCPTGLYTQHKTSLLYTLAENECKISCSPSNISNSLCNNLAYINRYKRLTFYPDMYTSNINNLLDCNIATSEEEINQLVSTVI